MLLAILFGVMLAIWIFGLVREWDGEGLVGLGFIWVALLVGGVIQVACDTVGQKNDYNSLSMLDSNRIIVEKKYDVIGAELRTELSKYQKHEDMIFDKITPGTMDIYLVKYPELRSVESITLLAQELAKLQAKIYDVDITYNRVVLKIKKRQENKFWYSIFTPRFEVAFR